MARGAAARRVRLTGNREDAEDAVQNALCQAVGALDGFRGEARMSTWLFRIVIRSAMRVAARRRPNADPVADPTADTPTPLAALSASEQADRLLAAVQRLPWNQRVVVSLSAVERLDRGAIAEVLGIPVGTVDSRLHHGRARLRELLGLDE